MKGNHQAPWELLKVFWRLALGCEVGGGSFGNKRCHRFSKIFDLQPFPSQLSGSIQEEFRVVLPLIALVTSNEGINLYEDMDCVWI